MGHTEDEEIHPSTPDLEETLPLYTETHPPNSTTPVALPDKTATPDEVRDFLVQILQARGVGLDRARRVAARWELGTGEELRSYPVAMFRDIFGVEDAWVVYKEAKIRMYREEVEQKRRDRKYGYPPLILLILLWAGAMAIQRLSDNEIWQFISIVYLAFGAFATVGFACSMFFSTDPEERVENELKGQWSKPMNTQTTTN